MRLDQWLVHHNNFTRSRAQLLITDGAVRMNGIVCTKANKTVAATDSVTVTDTITYVSRAGLKLQHALDMFNIFPAGKMCLDIGSSTGGFTDCLLTRGAIHVDAVDVGTDQLSPSLKSDSRVSSYEQTDIRQFKNITRYDMIVCDISFISLLKIIPEIPRFAKNTTEIILLIKPQFEVGKEFLGKGGIVHEDMRVVEIITDIVTMARHYGCILVDEVKQCPIRGGDGNQEYVVCFTYSEKSV